MPNQPGDSPLMALPRPGRALKVVLGVLLGLWLIFAVGLNWAHAPEQIFLLLCGNTERILRGEVWRLFTAPFLHVPTGTIGHILSALLGFYFLSPSLESEWGSARFLRFLGSSALFAYGLQMLCEVLLPADLSAKLVGQYWFGAMPVVEAIAIAWALQFRHQSVRLFFVLPVTSRGLIVFVVAMSVMYLIAGARPPEGLIAPFGGMLSGWLLGGGTPSPLRRLWLKLRLAQLDAETRREAQQRRKRAERSGLKVIQGGKKHSDTPPSGESSRSGGGRRGPDGRWLN